MKHRLSRLVVAGTVALAAMPLLASVAVAATPVPGAPFAGKSAHAKFSISATPECSAASPLPAILTCAQASYLDLTVTPAANAGKHCAPYGLEFAPMEIKPSGSYSGTLNNPDNWYLTVKGAFASLTTLKGTVDYPGCATDTFSLNIAAPVSTVPPCLMLSRAHAVNVISGGRPADVHSESFNGQSGECAESYDGGIGNGSVNLNLASSLATLPAEIGGMKKVVLKGLGPVGGLYAYVGDQESLSVVIEFGHGHSWGDLTLDYDVNAPCTPKTCITAPRAAAIENRVLSVVRALYKLA
jgi:hypothetical protein